MFRKLFKKRKSLKKEYENLVIEEIIKKLLISPYDFYYEEGVLFNKDKNIQIATTPSCKVISPIEITDISERHQNILLELSIPIIRDCVLKRTTIKLP